MRIEKIVFDEKYPEVYLECLIADKTEKFTRKAILVIPGGGYGSVCSQREGEPIALAFMARGYNAFILHYSVDRKKIFPAQLIEASMAMKHIRDNAEDYGIDKNKVFAVGFSAGGHLCASLGAMWDMEEIYNEIDMPFGYNKPTGVILGYAAITANPAIAHRGSFKNLLGTDNPTDEELAMCSVENYVCENSSPAFIMHTSDDMTVDVRNSMILADAYVAAGQKVELHIYPSGHHGIALANGITSEERPDHEDEMIEKWIEMADYWTKSVCE